MSKKISAEMEYNASCKDVFAMYSDTGFLAVKVSGTGGSDPTISVEKVGSDVVVDVSRTLPAQVPSVAKKFLGDTVVIDEKQQWSPADDKGARTASVKVTFQGAPASADGRLSLEPSADGSVCRVELEVRSTVPLVGGKIEEIIVEQLERAVRQETKLGNQWLAEHA